MSRISTCLNCQSEIRKGPFCENCGQRNVHARLDFASLYHDVKEQVFEFHLPWLYTMREMLLRPGKACREYMDGKRVKYVNPLKYVLYITSIVLLLLQVLPARYSADPDFVIAGPLFDTAADPSTSAGFLVTNPIILLIVLAPLIALLFKLIYSLSKYNNAEVSCFILYVLGNCVLIAFLIHLAAEWMAGHLLDLSTASYDYIWFFAIKILAIFTVVFGHCVASASVFFREVWYFSTIKVFIVALVYVISFSVSFGFLTEKAEQRNSNATASLADSELLFPFFAGTWVEVDQFLESGVNSSFGRGRSSRPDETRYGTFLLSAGRTRDGLYQILRGADAASAGDDNAASNSWDLAYAYLQSGQVAYARTQIDRLPSQDRQLLNLELALQTGDATELMTAAQALPARFDLIRELAQWWAEGNAEAALSEIRRVSGDSNSWSDIRALAARWAARFNDPRQAWTIFAGLDYKTDLWRSIWMPYFSEVRKLDEFKEFVRQDGLEEYWRTTGHWADTCRPLGDDDFECF